MTTAQTKGPRNVKNTSTKAQPETVEHKTSETAEVSTGSAVEVISPKNVAAQVHASQLPEGLQGIAGMAEDDAGSGTSQAAEDNIIPLIYILQNQSPQVLSNKPDYIEGAGPGDIWLKNAPEPIAPGESGIIVQPVMFSKAIVEWVPRTRGGGFVAQHLDWPEDTVKSQHPETAKDIFKRAGSKNDLVETRYHGVLINGIPFVIPMSSTAHTVSRGWMALMNQFRLPSGKVAPSWMRKYLLTTVLRTNAAGEWYTWKVEDLGWINGWGGLTADDEYQRGKQLYLAMSSGEMKAEAPASEGGAGAALNDSDVM